MKNIKLHIFLLLGFITTSLVINAQIRVIDNKGTVSTIDASKWTRIGTTNDIYDKFPGNVGIGTTTPMATLHNAGSTLLGVTNVSLTDPTYLPTAQVTVDAYSGIVITQQSTDLALTLPTPTSATAGRLFTVSNSITSTNYVKVSSCTLPAGMSVTLVWDGTQWSAPLASPITVVNNSNLFSTGLSSTGSGVTSTSNSNFLGLGAGYDATGASNSNFLGSGAGGIAMGASYSNFFGQNAGYNAITANNSNFLGQNAGQAATNASGANFLGSNTGYAASGATYSNFIGNNAGQWATNASYSTLLGYNVANENSLGTHIGSNNIIIGTNITLPATTANGINIGGVLFGLNTYSTTSGNPSSVATGSGKIGIGIVSPTAHLHLAASSGASGTAPLKLSAGTNLSTTEAGTIEYNGTHLYFTAINGGSRYQIDGQGLSLPLSSLTATVVTNNITNGDYDQTWNWNSSTTKNPFTIASNSLTTGNLFSLVNSNTSHTGNLLVLTSNATAPVGGITKFNFTGNHTGNGLEIDDVTASGAAVAINANALTTGTALNISSVSTSITGGQLLNVATSGVNVASGSTTTAATISNTHGGDTPTNVGLTVSAGGGLKNYALLVPSGYVGIGTNTPAAALDVKGQINITQASGTGSVGLVAPGTLTGYTLTLPSAQSSNGQTLQNDGLGNLSWVNGLTNSLTSANINVGNSSGVATPVSISGDATLANDGTLTLKPIISSGSYGSSTSIPTFTVDTKGRVTAASNVAASGTWGINITGNAGSASSVAWANVSSHPTALSQFTNDLGNYGGYALINGTNATGTWPVSITGNASGTATNVTGIVAAANGGTGVITVAAEQTRLGLGTMAYAATGSYALANGTNATGTWPVSITGNASGTAANVTGIVTGANGGTGVANNAKTITLGGSLTTSGAYTTTLTSTNTTTVTLPVTGTLATLAGTESLTNKTINGLTPTAVATGFTIAGGTTSKTLTVPLDASVSGTNTGDNASNSLYSSLVTNATHTGDVTGSTVLTIAPNVITNADLNQIATATIKGRFSALTGNVEDLTKTQVLTLLNVADGANNYIHPSGDGNLHVPATSTINNGKVLTAGATAGSISWVTPTTGTVTGVSGTLPITSSGGTAPIISIAASTPSAAGSMSAADKTKLDAITGTNTGDVTLGTANGLSLAGQAISLGLASTSTAGALSSTDWNSFNNKVSASGYLPLTGGTLTGALSGTTATFSGVVKSGTGNGFQNASFVPNVANNIWSFASSPGYGMAYYQGTALVGGDAIGFHFGNQATPLFYVNTGGNAVLTGSITAGGNVTAYSDIRLKKNIHTLPNVSESLRKINAVEFDRKDMKIHQLGFIAQNVQQYFPDLVTVAKDSMATLSLNYQAMTAPLLKGWQEHDAVIISQQAEINTQHQEIDLLKKEIELLKINQEELKKLITNKK